MNIIKIRVKKIIFVYFEHFVHGNLLKSAKKGCPKSSFGTPFFKKIRMYKF